MNATEVVKEIVDGFDFQKDDYIGAEIQLTRFAKAYSNLNREQAVSVRAIYSPKSKLLWFRISTSLVEKGFSKAALNRKHALIDLFLATYSFDNLEFGYDTLLGVSDIAKQIDKHQSAAKLMWKNYKPLTTNPLAVENIEKGLFS